MRLSANDLDALQRAILALHECRDIPAFSRRLPEIVLKLVPADHFYLFEFKFSPRFDQAKLVGMIEPLGLISPSLARFAEERLLDHPFPEYFARTGNPTALKISDFHSTHHFRNTEAYQRFYRALGIEWQLAVPANFGLRTVGGLSLGNKRKDFTERDRLLVNLVRPHVELAHGNAKRWTAWKESHRKPMPVPNLTRRESDIAHWLGEGKTNPEIAFILASNVRTVEKHVESILAKVGVENRTAAAVTFARMSGAAPAGTEPNWKPGTGGNTQTGTSPGAR